ncbi:MAG TPA: hypothetical protein VLT47_07285 [Anaeromyxobacteraceae bacterium]|nr:hypothetical protein [Anaeromyxobacteraceae bacterium]
MRAALLTASLAALAACGGSSSSSMSSADCTAFTDLTATTAVINFGGTLGNRYDPRCAKVKVSQSITFDGDFSVHPLSQTSGAAVIPHTASGTTLTFSIPTAGTFGYQCDVHHASGMTGALQVVP